MLCISGEHFPFFPPAAGSCFSYTLRLRLVEVDWIVGPATLAEIEIDKVLKMDNFRKRNLRKQI